ncbi:MAG: nucleotide exchange factor GrpE [Candidatus Neomarinimicrobiota bacterium]
MSTKTKKSKSKKPNSTKSQKSTVKKKDTKKIKFEELIANIMALEDRHLRLKAEFENYRKRKEREIISLLKYNGEDIIVGILPILDDLSRMVDASKSHKNTDSQSIIKGIELIQSKLVNFISKLDVTEFAEPGDILDINLHDALMVKENKKKKDNEILEVFEKGYRYKDRVIRHAKVIVNKS